MTKPLVVSIPHQLSKADVRARIDKGVADFRAGHTAQLAELTESWNGDRLTFSAAVPGGKVTGRIDVEDKSVRVEVDLPWMLAMLASRFQKRIETDGKHLLE